VFPHAFDPLARIVRESRVDSVRAAALHALARIDTPAAAEFLLGVLEHGGPVDRAAALDALRRSASRAFLEVSRGALRTGSPELQAALRDVLKARGA
jgi:HEAT repeat protein